MMSEKLSKYYCEYCGEQYPETKMASLHFLKST